MSKILNETVAWLRPYWHIPAGVLISLVSLWVGFGFIHFCPGWMEAPGVFTMLAGVAAGIVLACKNVDWFDQY